METSLLVIVFLAFPTEHVQKRIPSSLLFQNNNSKGFGPSLLVQMNFLAQHVLTLLFVLLILINIFPFQTFSYSKFHFLIPSFMISSMGLITRKLHKSKR